MATYKLFFAGIMAVYITILTILGTNSYRVQTIKHFVHEETNSILY